MTLSDWVVFVRVVSCIVLTNTGLVEAVISLWRSRREAAMSFLDDREGQHQQHLIDNAQSLLANYAEAAEK
jgi:hypothetical protein